MDIRSAIRIAEERRRSKVASVDGELLKKVNNDFQQQVRVHNKRYMADICNAIEHDNQQGKTRDLFKRVKEITRGFTPRLGIVKSKGRRILQKEKKNKGKMEKLH